MAVFKWPLCNERLLALLWAIVISALHTGDRHSLLNSPNMQFNVRVPTKSVHPTRRKGMYEVLPKISENLNIPRKSLALRTCAARCLFLYLSTVTQPTGVFTCFRVLAVFFTPFSYVSAITEMVDVKEQRICVKFCFKLNKTAAETYRMLKEAFGEKA